MLGNAKASDGHSLRAGAVGPPVFDGQELYRLMVEAVGDYAIFMLDPEGIVRTWNLGGVQFKGYEAEEIVGHHFSIFYLANEADDAPAEELAIADAEGRFEGEGWRVRKDGSTFWAHVVLTALRNPDGSLLGFTKVTQDLTEVHRTARELAAANAHVNSVLDCMSDSVVTIGPDWTLLYGNQKARASLPDFEVGANYWSCFPAVLGTPTEDLLRNAMETRSETQYELYYEPYQVWFKARAFPTDDGLSIFFSNITEDKRMGEQLELEQLLREKRVEALSHMAGGLAHEISNPLAIIHGRAFDLRSLAEGDAPLAVQDVWTACDSIVKTADRASGILRGLRGFAREGSHDPMQLASMDEIVEGCVEMQQTRFERHGIELRIECDLETPMLMCRETQIGQIVTNLLNNAFDAIVQSDAKERWIAVAVEQVEQDVKTDVTDSGPGIEDHFKAHLMEPFFTTKELSMGMGVGLSLSRAIAQDHGGTLTLLKDTRNTCFRLVLPLRQGKTKEDLEDRLAEVVY